MEREGGWHSANTINGLIEAIDSRSQSFVGNYSIFPRCRCNCWLSLSDSMLLQSEMDWNLWENLWKRVQLSEQMHLFPHHGAKAVLGVASCNLGNVKVCIDGEMCSFFLVKHFCVTARFQRQTILCDFWTKAELISFHTMSREIFMNILVSLLWFQYTWRTKTQGFWCSIW